MPGQGGHEPVPAGPAAGGDRGARVGVPAAAPARTGRAPAAAARRRPPTRGHRLAAQAPRRAATLPAPAPTTFPDDWFLRRGEFAPRRPARHGVGGRAGRRDALARRPAARPAGSRSRARASGFFSPLVAGKGELHVSDPDGAALDRARDRLLAHRLRAHLHVADPWVVPARPGEPGADAVLAAFLLGRVRGAGLDTATASLLARLRPGGRLASIELLPDPAGGPPATIPWTWHDPDVVEASLRRAGFRGLERTDDRALLPARGGRGRLTPANPGPVLEAGGRETRCYPPARCPPSRTARSRPSAPA